MGRSSRILMIVAMAALVALGASGRREAAAQDAGWVKVYDVPAPNFGAVEMFDDTRGIAAGVGGLFYTTDGGASWQEGSSDQVVALGGAFSTTAYISFADADHAWVAGFSGQMWRTTDGGRSWRKQQTNTTAHFNSVSAVGPNEAWAAAYGEGFSDVGPIDVQASVLLHTTDGGATWQQAFRSSKYGVFNQVQFVDAQRGWLIATPCFPGQPSAECRDVISGRSLLRTDDGGSTWTDVAMPADTLRPRSMQWFANGRGYLAAFDATDSPSLAYEAAFYRTDDGGDTWTKVTAPEPDGGLGWRFMSPDLGFASITTCKPDGDCTSSMVRSPDGGVTWTSFADGPLLFAPSFDATSTTLLLPSAATGNASGIALIDLTTTARREAAVPGHEAFYAIDFATRDRGYAVNRAGLYVSDDGGAHWRVGPTPVQAFGLAAPARDVIWILGTDPSCMEYCTTVHRSVDGGRTWTGAPQRFGGANAIDAIDGATAWLSADDGLWRTTDGGRSWQRLNDDSGPWEFIDRNFGFARSCESCDRQFPVTHDGGVTVEMRPLPYFPYPSFFLTPSIGWASGEIRDPAHDCGFCWAVYRTTDGARTWDEMWRSASEFTGEVVFIDAVHGWGVQGTAGGPNGGRGGVASTADGGRTWTTELPDVGGELIARDGRLWSAMSAQPTFGGGLFASRTTIWRREIAGGITLPDSGDGTRADRHEVALALMLALAGAAALLAAGRRARSRVR